MKAAFHNVKPAQPATVLRVPAEIVASRRAMCAGCEFNLNDRCSKCDLCGGSKIEVLTQFVLRGCPLKPPKWTQYMRLPTALV